MMKFIEDLVHRDGDIIDLQLRILLRIQGEVMKGWGYPQSSIDD
jgi:hypothetical protein